MTQTTTKIEKTIAYRMTIEEMQNDDAKNYNQTEWLNNIKRMQKYSNVKFYKVPADEFFSYDRFYVEYTIEEGIRLFKTFSYSSCIHNGGFYEVMVLDGEMNWDNHTYTAYEENKVAIVKKGFGKENQPLNHTKAARQHMIEWSTKYGMVFTNDGIY
jgi:hypothetical protein